MATTPLLDAFADVRDEPQVTPNLSPAELLELASALASTADPSCLPPPGPQGPDGVTAARRYVRISTAHPVEAWLIEWPPDTGLELHDHGGAAGALHVVQGTLLEAQVDRVVAGPMHYHRVSRGGAITFGPATVHDVVNPTTEVAVSVHVYAPALTSMTFYDHRTDQLPVARRTERLGDDGWTETQP
jgi:hypothetical protein